MMLTGGEKYNTKQIIIKISEIYPNIKTLLEDEKHATSNSSLSSYYNYTLEIFTLLMTNLTNNIITAIPAIRDIFAQLQEVHYYKDVNNNNKEALITVVKRIPELQEELIKLVEGDTTNRDAVLKQIMDELGIVDPNAKKRHSLW